jgi:hypothetical protein
MLKKAINQNVVVLHAVKDFAFGSFGFNQIKNHVRVRLKSHHLAVFNQDISKSFKSQNLVLNLPNL